MTRVNHHDADALRRIPDGRWIELPGDAATFVREVGPTTRSATGHDAPTVVLLHGLAGTGALNWFSAFEPLSTSFHVIAPDLRGHGRGLRSSRRFRLADCADDVVALTDAVGVDRFIVAGYSMGGAIAQLLAARHADRVAGLVLCATAPCFREHPTEWLQFAALGVVAACLGILPRRVRPWSARTAMQLSELRTSPAAISPAFAWEELRRHDVRMVVEAADALGRFTSRPWIEELNVPTSVVLTTKDHLVPLDRQRSLVDAIPGAVGYPLQADHLACARCPDEFADVLTTACELVAARSGYAIDWLSPAA